MLETLKHFQNRAFLVMRVRRSVTLRPLFNHLSAMLHQASQMPYQILAKMFVNNSLMRRQLLRASPTKRKNKCCDSVKAML